MREGRKVRRKLKRRGTQVIVMAKGIIFFILGWMGSAAFAHCTLS